MELLSTGRHEPVDPLPAAALERYLDELGLGAGRPTAEPIGEGHSNLTYRVRREGCDVVLRRPPVGPLPPSAHDVLREARVIAAAAGHVRVPEILAVCEDPAVIGAPFYLMTYIPGVTVHRAIPDGLQVEGVQHALVDALVESLVEIHALDWRAAGLETFGRAEDYAQRQLRRFTGLWERNRTRELKDVDAVTRWLGDHLPEQAEATIVHGDYRIGNVLYSPQAPVALVAVLDWELATIGNPLADVGYLLATYAEPGEDTMFSRHNPVTTQPGFPRREELAELYGEKSGRRTTDVRWYTIMALWKSAIFLEGSYQRHLAGSTEDPFFAELEQHVPALAQHAVSLTGAA